MWKLQIHTRGEARQPETHIGRGQSSPEHKARGLAREDQDPRWGSQEVPTGVWDPHWEAPGSPMQMLAQV